MPSGKVHASVSLLTAGYSSAFAAFAALTDFSHIPWLCAAAGALVGILISPDLDVDQGNISHYIVRRRAGMLFAVLWAVYWYPYARLIPHRSWVSHFPFISTLIRAIYAFWFIPLLLPGIIDPPLLWWMTYAFMGLVISDFNHWFLDVLSGSWQ